ncbi:hypothetical protein PAXRUDRAFT_829769 [Paxillus rubicundulus Ve08.2h10]|uniref:Uncharacterized protein n=1 Tax=Paxillus rubicundulus Ve08.2h10 TaxID=930991 RepID=A0A0D0D6X4_9AGAM|nr:hypothetical protein PAXRUDRAFT_829769 [Paxillus rubicundulus Ve08.2h10]
MQGRDERKIFVTRDFLRNPKTHVDILRDYHTIPSRWINPPPLVPNINLISKKYGSPVHSSQLAWLSPSDFQVCKCLP